MGIRVSPGSPDGAVSKSSDTAIDESEDVKGLDGWASKDDGDEIPAIFRSQSFKSSLVAAPHSRSVPLEGGKLVLFYKL
jgi:hypothetical protein